MRKKKIGKIILLEVKETQGITMKLDVDDDVYHAMVKAGRKHVVDDDQECFRYAMTKALLELEDRLK
jgi:hypothetical protein